MTVLASPVSTLGPLVPAPLAGWLLSRAFTLTARRRTRSAEAEVMRAARRRSVVWDEGRVAAYEWGWSDKTVVLVHGWRGDAAQMTRFVRPLVAEGVRVVAYDAPAHGASPGWFTTAAHMGRALAAVAEDVGGVHAAVGHSLGSQIIGIAARHGLSLQRLALVAPAPSVRPFADGLIRSFGLSPAGARASRDAILRRAGVSGWHDLDLPVVTHKLPDPLVVHGESDRYVPIRTAERLVNGWPGARLVRAANQGHSRILADDSVVDQIVDHLAA